MARYKINAVLRLAFLMAVNVWTADKPRRQVAHGITVALNEMPHVVAKAAIPLLPSVADKASHLVKPRGIPRLRNECGSSQQGVGLDIPQHRWVRQRVSHFVAR